MRMTEPWWSPVRASGAGVATLPLDRVAQPADREREEDAIEREVTALFDQLRDPILRYLLSMGLPVTDGEDVVQDTFLALFNHLRRGRPRTNLAGWTFRTAHNLGLKRRRSLHRNRSALGDLATAGFSSDLEPDPEQRLEGVQRYEKMCAVVGALPERDRFCLGLRAEGLRYRVIARILGISLGSVSNSISRAVTRLQEAGL